MANVIKPMVRDYPDGKHNKTNGSGLIPMANVIKPMVWVHPDGKRNKTNGSGLIPMANGIKPIVPGLSRWQTL